MGFTSFCLQPLVLMILNVVKEYVLIFSLISKWGSRYIRAYTAIPYLISTLNEII
jgi:hypothetical protein